MTLEKTITEALTKRGIVATPGLVNDLIKAVKHAYRDKEARAQVQASD